MLNQESKSKPIHPVRATAPVVGGLLAGAIVLAGVVWWARPIRVEALSVEKGPPAGERASLFLPSEDEGARAGEPTPEAPAASAEAGALAGQGEPAPPAGAEEVVLALEDARPGADHLEEAQSALEAGDLRAAYAALRRHLFHNPPTFDVLLRVGRLARELDDLTLSAEAFERATALVPDDPEGYLQLARTRLEQGENAAAESAARASVRLAPDEAIAWNLLGRAEMAESRWEAAELAFERALALDPANPHLYNNRGLLLVYMRRGEEAVDALETAVELFGDEAPHYVLNNLGLAFELSGRLEAARGAFEEALALSPFYVKARVNLRRIDRALDEVLETSARRVADGAAGLALAGPRVGPEGGSPANGEALEEGTTEPTAGVDLGLEDFE